MKTSIFSTLIVLFFSSSVFSQGKIGVRFFTGYQFSEAQSAYLVNPDRIVDYNLSVSDVSASQSVGLFSHFDFGFLYLEPEVLYTRYNILFQGTRFKTESSIEFSEVEIVEQIDLPINAGIQLKNVRIAVGPVFHVLKTNSSKLYNDSPISISNNNLTTGFQGTIGYSWKIFHFDLRYQKEFNSLTDHMIYNKNTIDLNSQFSSLQLGLAVALNTKR